MSKLLNKSNLSERSIRTLLVVSLSASMAAFGCTTDRNLGNGDPVRTPGLRSVPTGGTSAGSESAVPPPMMSSYTAATQPQMARLSAAEAAAIMAQQQPRVRVLGPASPDNGGRAYASDVMLPQQQGDARYSVNSTIYSRPTEAVASGAGEPVSSNTNTANFVDTSGGVAVSNSGFTSASTIAGSSVVTGATTTNSTNVTNAAAPLIAPSGTAITPTSNAVSAPSSFASVRNLSPTAAAVVNPPASISGSPALATSSSSRTAGTTNTDRTVSVSSVSPTTSVGVANPVRVLNTSGRITITNTGATRQQ